VLLASIFAARLLIRCSFCRRSGCWRGCKAWNKPCKSECRYSQSPLETPGSSFRPQIAHQLEQSGLRALPVGASPPPTTFSIPGPSRRTTPALAQNGETQELIISCLAAVGGRVSQHTVSRLIGEASADARTLTALNFRRSSATMLSISRRLSTWGYSETNLALSSSSERSTSPTSRASSTSRGPTSTLRKPSTSSDIP